MVSSSGRSVVAVVIVSGWVGVVVGVAVVARVVMDTGLVVEGGCWVAGDGTSVFCLAVKGG